MVSNSRICKVGNQMGLVTKSYTHTMDVFLFKKRRIMYGVHKKYVKLLPVEKRKNDRAQLTLDL
jgi:hypothetical protein